MSIPLSTPRSTANAESLDAKSLVQLAAESDHKIHSWEAHVTTSFDGHVMCAMDWGYDRGMEFRTGSQYLKFPNETNYRQVNETWKFDGEKMRGVRDQHGQPPLVVGVIRGLTPDTFSGVPNVGTLLGTDLKYEAHLRFGEALLACPNVYLRERPEFVDGRACRVLELVEADKMIDGRVFDALVWIDPDRDFRVVRYEKYINEHGRLRWKVLHQRIESTKFENIDGCWFPVAGKVDMISNDFEPEPTTQRTSAGPATTEPEESGLKVVQTRVYRYDVEVRPGSTTVNKAIPKEKFAVEFPPGCLVVDDLLNTQYRVGGTVPKQLSAIGTSSPTGIGGVPEMHGSFWSSRRGWAVIGLGIVMAAISIVGILRFRSARRRIADSSSSLD